jgi:hypothetical protein
MERQLTRIGKVLKHLTMGHGLSAGSRQVTAALKFIIARDVAKWFRRR